MSTDLGGAPIDEESATRLAAGDLELRLVDTADAGDFAAWMQADHRGFYAPAGDPELIEAMRRRNAGKRTTGVFDASVADPAVPVATVQSWATALSVPGAAVAAAAPEAEVRALGLWAIASVTVAPTHRRRGVARALLEAELRTAARLGVPVAGLTVSEATLYGRYGFGPAVFADHLEIETARVAWTAPAVPGRVHFVSPEQLQPSVHGIAERVHASRPGGIRLDDQLLDRAISFIGPADERARRRLARYDDADGAPQGFVVYEVRESGDDFTKHVVEVQLLLGATDEATAALWRFLLELDLVSTVKAWWRPVDDPVSWVVTDRRAVRSRRQDFEWLRILDVPEALGARGYAAAGRIALRVSDPLGFAAGHYLLETDAAGAATVTTITGEAPADAASVALSISELSSLYLGGVDATTLVRAGLVFERTPGAASVVDGVFRTARAPWLSMEY